jgi:hypothetical protein
MRCDAGARRTFAVNLRRCGVGLDTIRRLLGLVILSAVKLIVDTDPVRLEAIVARAQALRGGKPGSGVQGTSMPGQLTA